MLLFRGGLFFGHYFVQHQVVMAEPTCHLLKYHGPDKESFRLYYIIERLTQ